MTFKIPRASQRELYFIHILVVCVLYSNKRSLRNFPCNCLQQPLARINQKPPSNQFGFNTESWYDFCRWYDAQKCNARLMQMPTQKVIWLMHKSTQKRLSKESEVSCIGYEILKYFGNNASETAWVNTVKVK